MEECKTLMEKISKLTKSEEEKIIKPSTVVRIQSIYIGNIAW